MAEPRGDGTTLLKGTGFGMLGQFAWAELVPAGALIPDEKLPTAKAALEAMGYVLTTAGGDTQRRAGGRAMPMPLPECAACTRPYRRDHTPAAGEHCQHCGQPLTLTQRDPDRDMRAAARSVNCPRADTTSTPAGRRSAAAASPRHETATRRGGRCSASYARTCSRCPPSRPPTPTPVT